MLKNMVAVSLLAVLVLVGVANAADFGTITVDTAPVFLAATTIVTALAGVWAIRKVIKTINKS
jgi:hypothetical protein